MKIKDLLIHTRRGERRNAESAARRARLLEVYERLPRPTYAEVARREKMCSSEAERMIQRARRERDYRVAYPRLAERNRRYAEALDRIRDPRLQPGAGECRRIANEARKETDDG